MKGIRIILVALIGLLLVQTSYSAPGLFFNVIPNVPIHISSLSNSKHSGFLHCIKSDMGLGYPQVWHQFNR
jgi:hypothetical protein